LLGWNKSKSKLLKRLAEITPTIEIKDDSAESDSGADSPELRAYNVAVIVNKALDGDMGSVNDASDVITRGKAKALLIKIKRGTADRPAIPDKVSSAQVAPAATASVKKPVNSAPASLSKDDMIAIAVNKALDGDSSAIDDLSDKIVKAKSKALLMKIQKGTAERPKVPNSNQPADDSQVIQDEKETDAQLIERLTAEGLDGKMDEINNLENKVLRGKIKAAIVKAKRNA